MYQRVLKDLCKIRTSLLDTILPGQGAIDRRFFTPVLRVNDFVLVNSAEALDALARRCGVGKIHSLSDLEDAAEKLMDDSMAGGIAGLKSACAYERPIRYEKVTRSVAEGVFNALRSEGGFYGPPAGFSLALGDYMMHHICRLADRRGLAFQMHTGLQEGNGNYIEHSNPSLLTNLFLEYTNVRFDCFHISYPYQGVLSALAKNFRNVFIDFCWAHIVSPTAAVTALVEFLDAVPANKISGFGGDYCLIDGVYGHQYLARENISRALAIKVEQGVMDVERACQIGKMLLHDNPVAIFDLSRFLRA
jgi:predicted TIM-barrel fold metal-dependent hydrolase